MDWDRLKHTTGVLEHKMNYVNRVNVVFIMFGCVEMSSGGVSKKLGLGGSCPFRTRLGVVYLYVRVWYNCDIQVYLI